MVAIVRCQEIALKKYDTAKKEWPQMEAGVKCGTVPGFVNQLKSLVDVCLSEYDAESMGYAEGARSTHRNQLQQNLLQLFDRAFRSALEDIRFRAWNEFKHSLDSALNGGQVFSEAANSCIRSCMSHFDEECPDVGFQQAKSDKNEVMEKLQRDIDVYITYIRAAKISELTSSYQEILKEVLAEPVESILGEAKSDAWPSIRNLLRKEITSAISYFLVALSGFDVDGDTREENIKSLRACARSVVEGKVRNEARKVSLRMKDMFIMLFSLGSDSMPRVWNGSEDIKGLAKTARTASLELLSIMAAIRLDNDDNIKTTFMKRKTIKTAFKTSKEFDPLASSSWEQVPSSQTVITPLKCKELWDQFMTETNQIIVKATEQQNIAKATKKDIAKAAKQQKTAENEGGSAVAFISVLFMLFGIPLPSLTST